MPTPEPDEGEVWALPSSCQTRSVTNLVPASASRASRRTGQSSATVPSGQTILVHGVLGGVGELAAQLARWARATVIGTVRHAADLEQVHSAVAQPVALDRPDPADAIRALAPEPSR